MLYDLLVPLARDSIVFNVFRYITFRAAMATVTAIVISFLLGPWLIARLRALQDGAETIREDTPERHRGKAGTPSMGGWAAEKVEYVYVAGMRTAPAGAPFR